MRFRLGLMLGFAVGYYLGAKAGHERYLEINRWLDRARGSDAYETATEKARAVLDLGVERARDLVGQGTDTGNGTPADVASRDEPLAKG